MLACGPGYGSAPVCVGRRHRPGPGPTSYRVRCSPRARLAWACVYDRPYDSFYLKKNKAYYFSFFLLLAFLAFYAVGLLEYDQVRV